MKRSGIKVLTVGLAVLLVLSTFCMAASAEKTTLRMMVWGSTESREKSLAALKEVYPELFERIELEIFVGGSGDPECAEKIRLGLAANENVADICQLNYTQLPEFARAGVLNSVEDIIAPVRDNLLEGYRLLSEYDGECLAIPGTIKTKLWFYRKDIFAEAGIDPTQIKTLDEFIEAGKKLKEINPNYHMWSIGDHIEPYDYMMILSGTDAQFCLEDGTWQLTKNPNFAKALDAMKQIKDAGIATPINEWTPDWEKAFADGLYVSYPNALWLANLQFMPKYAAGQEGLWACTQWPSFIGEEGGSEAGGDIYVIPKFCTHVEEAKELMAAWQLTDEGSLIVQKYNATPPLLKTALEDPRAQTPDPFVDESLLPETIKAAESFKIFPWDPCAAQELSIISPYFDAAINGQMPIDEALAAAEADLMNQIGNPYDN